MASSRAHRRAPGNSCISITFHGRPGWAPGELPRPSHGHTGWAPGEQPLAHLAQPQRALASCAVRIRSEIRCDLHFILLAFQHPSFCPSKESPRCACPPRRKCQRSVASCVLPPLPRGHWSQRRTWSATRLTHTDCLRLKQLLKNAVVFVHAFAC